MTRTSLRLFVLLAIFIPHFAYAQVIISEFLFDAAGTDVDQEFVELYNTGESAVDLTKWKINDGSNHTLNVPPKNGGTGSISVPAGGYALLVDNATDFLASHPGLGGTVIDTVLSLGNTGGTIMLLDESGVSADSVTYTKDQGAGGDGNSLQRSGASWLAAAPTMNATNATSAALPATSSEESQAATSSSTTNSNTSANSQVSSYVSPPSPEVFADGGADRTVIVGADTEFRGRAYNKKQDVVDNVRFNWNFGDGATAEGASVLHHFDYPGKYAVILTIAQNLSAASDRIIVTAEPAKMNFSVNPDGSVSIENNAGRDIDISRWIIGSFGRSFVFPDDTVILAGQTMRVGNARIGFTVGPQTELQYPNGVRAEISAVQQAPVVQPVVPEFAPVKVSVTSESNPSEPIARNFVPETSDSATDTEEISEVSAGPVSQTAAAGSVSDNSYLWWLGAFSLALAASGAAFAVKRVSRGEWTIIDDTAE